MALAFVIVLLLLVQSSITIRIPTNSGSASKITTNVPPSTTPPHPRNQNVNFYYTTCIHGFEGTLLRELQTILEPTYSEAAATVKMGRSGCSFSGPVGAAYLVLLWSRVALRLLEQVGDEFTVTGSKHLYETISENVDVKRLLLSNPEDGEQMLTLSVRTTMPSNRSDRIPQTLKHSHFTALTVKNALVDNFRDLSADGKTRPDIDVHNADVPLTLALSNGDPGEEETAGCKGMLYRGLSARSLHRRGYRTGEKIHAAALKETIAAGLLLEAGYHRLVDDAKKTGEAAVLTDCMMGSGTFLIEGAMIAADVSPYLMGAEIGGGREAGAEGMRFLRWDNADPTLWHSLVHEAKSRESIGRDFFKSSLDRIIIAGCDMHFGAYSLAKAGVKNAGFGDCIRLSHSSFSAYSSVVQELLINDRSLMVLNPPWDHRIAANVENKTARSSPIDHSSPSQSELMFGELGESLKSMQKRFECFILFPPSKAYGGLKLKRSRSFTFETAKMKLKWLKYDLFGAEF